MIQKMHGTNNYESVIYIGGSKIRETTQTSDYGKALIIYFNRLNGLYKKPLSFYNKKKHVIDKALVKAVSEMENQGYYYRSMIPIFNKIGLYYYRKWRNWKDLRSYLVKLGVKEEIKLQRAL